MLEVYPEARCFAWGSPCGGGVHPDSREINNEAGDPPHLGYNGNGQDTKVWDAFDFSQGVNYDLPSLHLLG